MIHANTAGNKTSGIRAAPAALLKIGWRGWRQTDAMLWRTTSRNARSTYTTNASEGSWRRPVTRPAGVSERGWAFARKTQPTKALDLAMLAVDELRYLLARAFDKATEDLRGDLEYALEHVPEIEHDAILGPVVNRARESCVKDLSTYTPSEDS